MCFGKNSVWAFKNFVNLNGKGETNDASADLLFLLSCSLKTPRVAVNGRPVVTRDGREGRSRARENDNERSNEGREKEITRKCEGSVQRKIAQKKAVKSGKG